MNTLLHMDPGVYYCRRQSAFQIEHELSLREETRFPQYILTSVLERTKLQ